MLIIEAGEICKLSLRCPHSDGCWGTRSERTMRFKCDFVDSKGNIREDAYRNPHDQTGRMKIIMETE
jgi:hypothetical protein